MQLVVAGDGLGDGTGSRSTGSRSIALSRKIQMKIVSAIGPTILRLVALWTMALAWSSTISIMNSIAAWKRPGTPDVTRRAAIRPISQENEAQDRREQHRVPVDRRGSRRCRPDRRHWTGGSGDAGCIHRRSVRVLLRPCGRSFPIKSSTRAPCERHPIHSQAPGQRDQQRRPHHRGAALELAVISIAIEQTIFADSQPSRPSAVVMRRLAVRQPRRAARHQRARNDRGGGAKQSADHNAGNPNTSPTSSEMTAPASACTITTRHGDGADPLIAKRFGLRCRQAARQRDPRRPNSQAWIPVLSERHRRTAGTLVSCCGAELGRLMGVVQGFSFTRSFLNVAPGTVPNSVPAPGSLLSIRRGKTLL